MASERNDIGRMVFGPAADNARDEKLRLDLKHGAVTMPSSGVCCSCGYSGEEETECPKREDKTHCEHWWEGAYDGK